MLVTLLTRPWLHFVLFGVLIYAVQAFWSTPAVDVIESPSAESIAKMRSQWLRTTGKPINQQQLQQLIDNTIDREILFREAISREWHLQDPLVRQRLIRDMRFIEPSSTLDDERLFKQAIQLGLHQNNLVVRRRLIQMMEFSALASIRDQQPDDAILQSRFKANADQFMTPAIFGFEHVFINRDKHPEPHKRANQLQVSFATKGCADNVKVSAQSDAFLHGLKFKTLSARQAERYFGEVFVEQLLALAKTQRIFSQAWLGPLSSSYGQHFICLHSYQPPQPQSFKDVRRILLAQWQQEQQQAAFHQFMKKLRARFEVRL